MNRLGFVLGYQQKIAASPEEQWEATKGQYGKGEYKDVGWKALDQGNKERFEKAYNENLFGRWQQSPTAQKYGPGIATAGAGAAVGAGLGGLVGGGKGAGIGGIMGGILGWVASYLFGGDISKAWNWLLQQGAARTMGWKPFSTMSSEEQKAVSVPPAAQPEESPLSEISLQRGKQP